MPTFTCHSCPLASSHGSLPVHPIPHWMCHDHTCSGATHGRIHGTVEADIERNNFSVEKGDDVIGRLAAVRLEKGDTLPDIARHFSLGINASVQLIQG